jgi:pimeloyl-ACP methyl ester carboxylesterase
MITALTERFTLSSLIWATTLAGQSFYHYQLNHLRRRFERAGLHAYRARLGDAEVHYWAGGRPGGRPLLLIHGFGGDALFGWEAQTDLAKRRFLIIPDLLWFGGSHGKVDDWSSTYQAEVMLRLLDHLAVEQVDVVGVSYGGFVTLELAVQAPTRVNRYVLVDSPGPTYTMADYHAMLERQDLDSVADLVVPQRPEGVQRLVRLAYYRPPPVPLFVARDIFEHMYTQRGPEKVRLLDDMLARAGVVTPADYATDHPVLVLWGEFDELFPLALAHRLAAGLGPRAHVRVIRKANHAPNMEWPALFNREVLGFLGG